MSEIEDEYNTVIVHYSDEQKCEIEVNLETYKKILSRDPEALQSLLDVYRDTKLRTTQECIRETSSPVPSQEFISLPNARTYGIWNEETENCLLEAYIKYCSSSHKWKRVADCMRIAGYTVTAEHCRDRWRKLAKRYQTKQRQLKAGKYGVQIPELWETCFGSDATVEEAMDSKGDTALQNLLKVYEQLRAESDSEIVIKPNAHDYTFWDLESELMLLESYFRHSQASQRWKKIEDDFKRNGIMMSAAKCRDKWRRLESKYHTRQKAGITRQGGEISELWELCFGSGCAEHKASSDFIITQDTKVVDDTGVGNDDTKMGLINNEKGSKRIVTEQLQKQTALQSSGEELRSECLSEPVNEVTLQTSDQEQLQNLSSLWNEDTENWLLESYLKHCNHSQKWTKVQEDMSKRGFTLTAEQYRDKWRRLERRYHTRQKQILQSGKCVLPIPELWQKCFGGETLNGQVLMSNLQPNVRVKCERIGWKDKQDGLTLSNTKSRKPASVQLRKHKIKGKQKIAAGLTHDGTKSMKKSSLQSRKRKRDTTVGQLIDYLKSRDRVLIHLHEEHNQILRELVDLLKQGSKG